MRRILSCFIGCFAVLCLVVIGASDLSAMPKPARKYVVKTAPKKEERTKNAHAVNAAPAAEDAAEKDADAEGVSVNPPVSYDLPEYAPNAQLTVGEQFLHLIGEEDTLTDIARSYGLGYVELRSANPDIDPWTPTRDAKIIIPARNILPRAPQRGIIINLGEMRLYYFQPTGELISYPIGIGREGLQTPLGQTTIVKKLKRPSWYPTKRMREEKPGLPTRVRTGPANPLGDRALYLGWPTFLIHGTNKPWGIGRRVSSGCIRMYPENIRSLYPTVDLETPVTVVDQPIKVAWLEDGLYMEAHPSRAQSDEIESAGMISKALRDKTVPQDLKAFIEKTAGEHKDALNWKQIEKLLNLRLGYPVKILGKDT